MGYKIAIIGAGPAGCTLGRLLTKNTASRVTIYEAEASVNARSQGGTLDLRPAGGLRALKEAGLWDEFQRLARYDGEALIIGDKNLKAWVKVDGTTGKESSSMARPEIDRSLLRTMLKESLPDDLVQWDYKVQRVYRNEKTKRLVLEFADGTVESDFDLVVGADGAWSKVRSVLTDVKPYYYGVHYVSLVISNAEKRYPELYQLANRGSVFTYSDGQGLSVQYMSDESLHIATTGVLPETWMKDQGVSVDDPAALKAALLDNYPDWHPLLRKCIEYADDNGILARPLHMLPLDHTWMHGAGCTLIGDAAHLMTPFAGLGVNTAMQDAVVLTEAVLAAQRKGGLQALDAEIQKFEHDMFKRMGKVMEISWLNCQDMLFAPDAPRSRIQNYITRVMKTQVNPVLAPLAAVGVHTYFAFQKLRQ